jgi:hypothetical protein
MKKVMIMQQSITFVQNMPQSSMMSSAFPAGIEEGLYPTHTDDRIALTIANQRLKYVSVFDIENETGW